MDAKHTPGPWSAEIYLNGEFDICAEKSFGRCLVLASRGRHMDRSDEMHANARLIASAPDLLAERDALLSQRDALREVLAKLVAEFDDMDEHRPLHVGCIQCTEGATPDRYNTGPCAYHAARAALSKDATDGGVKS